MKSALPLLVIVFFFGIEKANAVANCYQVMMDEMQSDYPHCGEVPVACGSVPGHPDFGIVSAHPSDLTFVAGTLNGVKVVGYHYICHTEHCDGHIEDALIGDTIECDSDEVIPEPKTSAANPTRTHDQCGSIVKVESQTLGEKIPIVGAEFTMNYFTSWVQGRIGDYRIKLPITGAPLQPGPTGFDVVVKYGSSIMDTSYPDYYHENYTYTYDWNGRDTLGALTLGSQMFDITLTTHIGVYDSYDSVNNKTLAVGSFKSIVLGLGGWIPSNFHFYDSNSHKLYNGDGSTRNVTAGVWGTTGFYVAEEDASLVYYFDSTGRQIYTKTGLLGTTILTFNYDSQGRLASIVDGFGRTTTFNRHSSGAFASITAPKGQVTRVVLDGDGYATSFRNPKDETYVMSYYGNLGLLRTFQKPGTETSYFAYDSEGNLLRDAHSGGFFFDIIRKAATPTENTSFSKVSRMGRVTSYVGNYDDAVSSMTTTEPGPIISTNSYIDDGSEITITNDGHGISKTETIVDHPRFGPLAKFRSDESYSYGSVNYSIQNTQNVVLSDPANPFSITTLYSDRTKGLTNVHTVYSPSTKTFTTSQPSRPNLVSKIDSFERLVSLKIGNLFPTEFTYTNENLTKIRKNNSDILSFDYNSSTGFLNSVTDGFGNTTGYVYDDAGRVSSTILPDLRVISFGYDSNGNLTQITPPNRPAHIFSFNMSELPSSYSPPSLNGVETFNTNYLYNNDKQLTRILQPDGNSINYTYNAATGVLEAILTPTRQQNFTMNSTNGLPSAIVDVGGLKTNISYAGEMPTDVTVNDASNALISSYAKDFATNGTLSSDTVTSSGGSSQILYGYDPGERLASAGDLTITYNSSNGLISGTSIGTGTNKITETYTYGLVDYYTTYQVKYGSTIIYKLQPTRESNGRIENKYETVNGTFSSASYIYDRAGRLMEKDIDGIVISTYGYDENSNRVSGKIGSQATVATYDSQDRMTAYNTLEFSYDGNGNLSSRTNTLLGTTTTYNYDVVGNLLSVNLPGSNVVTYEFDGYNRRVGVYYNGILQKRWVYMDQTRIAAELDASGNITKRFVYATKQNIPDYMIMGGVNYRIISDFLGSPRLVVKVSDGTLIERMDHDEFGRVVQDTNPGLLPFGFAGGLYDTYTGLVRFGARDYDAETGRWTGKDPTLFEGGGVGPLSRMETNLYGYSFNDPINFMDANGEFPKNIDETGECLFGNTDLLVTQRRNEIANLNAELNALNAQINRPQNQCGGPNTDSLEKRARVVKTILGGKQKELNQLIDKCSGFPTIN